VYDPRTITIISGGQTGADRAALDFAIEHGIPHGGWCPRGRLAEDDEIPARYQLEEAPSRKYAQRTEWNVRDSDATVVLTIAPRATGGTALALACALRLGKPALHVSRRALAGSNAGVRAADSAVIAASESAAARETAVRLCSFLVRHQVRRLNVAGPRASQEPEIAAFVRCVLQLAFRTSSTR
jgi:hypothetical protein